MFHILRQFHRVIKINWLSHLQHMCHGYYSPWHQHFPALHLTLSQPPRWGWLPRPRSFEGRLSCGTPTMGRTSPDRWPHSPGQQHLLKTCAAEGLFLEKDWKKGGASGNFQKLRWWEKSTEKWGFSLWPPKTARTYNDWYPLLLQDETGVYESCFNIKLTWDPGVS